MLAKNGASYSIEFLIEEIYRRKINVHYILTGVPQIHSTHTSKQKPVTSNNYSIISPEIISLHTAYLIYKV